jgi:hypothetical protein
MYCYLITWVSLQQIGLYKTASAAVPWERIDQTIWFSKACRRLHGKDRAQVSLCNFFILGVVTRVLLRSQWNHHCIKQDFTFEFERKRKEPERSDRNITKHTLKAMPIITKIKHEGKKKHILWKGWLLSILVQCAHSWIGFFA